MKKTILFSLILIFSQWGKAQEIFKKSLLLMGSNFEIIVVAKTQVEADIYTEAAIKEIQRIEKLISSWDPNTQTSEINRNAGIKPVKVSPELFQLIQRSIGISKLTDGAFDITFASMDKIWKFDGSMKTMPTQEEIAASVRNIGYAKIELNETESSVFLPQKGMKIGFGAIGKGYAADVTKKMLQNQGVKAGIINASGDMNTWGKQPDGTDWQVAITNPLNKDKAIGMLPIKSGAVVTSGDYERYVEFDGKRYAHIIDPRSGYPTSGIISVTVFAPKAELADALATSIFVMGIETGLNRVNQIPGVECLIIDDQGVMHTSEKLALDTTNHELNTK